MLELRRYKVECVVVLMVLVGGFVQAQPVFNPGTGTYYEVLDHRGLRWDVARDRAEGRAFSGMSGYLATITSGAENRFLLDAFPDKDRLWIGASDGDREGVWEWVTGPETGQAFWRGGADGQALSFADWLPSEPNNCCGGENFATWYGRVHEGWNDVDVTGGDGGAWGYIVEYSPQRFRRGFANDDKSLNIADAIAILSYLFTGGRLSCLAAADVNDDDRVDISDGIGLLGFLFLGTIAPPSPFEDCGGDPGPLILECASHSCA